MKKSVVYDRIRIWSVLVSNVSNEYCCFSVLYILSLSISKIYYPVIHYIVTWSVN